ncbi:hypothetical protein HDE_02815 [Halotydeus destructor]|nr:hypothetical protein HDE_02815 [Halotydeus destructor]
MEKLNKLDAIQRRIEKLEQLHVTTLTGVLTAFSKTKVKNLALKAQPETYDIISDDSDYDEPSQSDSGSEDIEGDADIAVVDLSSASSNRADSEKRYNLRPRKTMSPSINMSYEKEPVEEFVKLINPQLVNNTRRSLYPESPSKKFYSSDED